MNEERPHWQLWVDGTALPNPGRIGVGIVLIDPDGWRETHAIPLGRQGCNNEAELHALCAGLDRARAAGADHLEIISDSDFVVQHVRGRQTTGVSRLIPLIEAARGKMDHFLSADLCWVPRHRIQEADKLARQSLGLQAKTNQG
ncbi:ribonuclease HI family protein [Denitratisoma oestradiolicum]|uniref:Ribonuclease HI n=1 Tax=Denitratisoma oestradiolicum TaxID=311182 RepID=A0A6S6XV87_9PROT